MSFIVALSIMLFNLQGSPIMDGYSYPLSVMPGDSLNVYLNANRKGPYSVKLYDMAGAVVAEYKTTVFPQNISTDKPWENGFGYKPTLKIVTPKLKSGVYVWENRIPLIIRTKNPKIAVVYSSNTENAYCPAGGKGLYAYNSTEKISAPIVSFKRPINLPKHSEAFYRWFPLLNLQGVGYMTDLQLDNYDEWKNAELLIIAGHSEYWSLEGRKNFDRYVNEGKNVLILSGNTMWWQVRYSQNKEQLICYKYIPDPIQSPLLKTVNWDDPTLAYPITKSICAEFPRAGYGRKEDQGWDGYKITANSPLLEGTNLKKGDILRLPSDESDGAPLLGFDANAYPVVDRKALNVEKIEIIGFDKSFRIKEGYATWLVFKRSKTSGTVINMSSTDWCSGLGMGNEQVRKITVTSINKLLKKENVFSSEEPASFHKVKP